MFNLIVVLLLSYFSSACSGTNDSLSSHGERSFSLQEKVREEKNKREYLVELFYNGKSNLFHCSSYTETFATDCYETNSSQQIYKVMFGLATVEVTHKPSNKKVK